jgi:DNA primase
MGKTYIDTVKYLVHSNVDIGGLVEKPDVVGAIFGQTEGLLGDELDLRDLQKNGRIGRIEVDLNEKDGRTQGTIKIPSSLDMVETCIIAAALETVDRVGPCEANIKIIKVEDTRNIKRKALIDRAKGLLKALINTELPESKEISEMVRGEVKAAEIEEYGMDKLPAGPNIDKTNEVIFVEGRADVINMLKNDITNVVAIQGAKVTQTILRLSKEKEVTIFLDGDRGGDIILNELVQAGADIDFVARAPTGKEVEELTRKELIKCLRGKVPFEQGKDGEEKGDYRGRRDYHQGSQRREHSDYGQRERYSGRERYQKPAYEPQYTEKPHAEKQFVPERTERAERTEKPVQQVSEIIPIAPTAREVQTDITFMPKEESFPKLEPARARIEPISQFEDKKPQKYVPKKDDRKEEPKQATLVKVTKEDLSKELEELNNTLKARFYNSNFERVKEMPVRDVIKALEEVNDAHAIVFDGIITQRLVDLAFNKGVKTLMGVKIGNVNKRPDGIEIITKSK